MRDSSSPTLLFLTCCRLTTTDVWFLFINVRYWWWQHVSCYSVTWGINLSTEGHGHKPIRRCNRLGPAVIQLPPAIHMIFLWYLTLLKKRMMEGPEPSKPLREAWSSVTNRVLWLTLILSLSTIAGYVHVMWFTCNMFCELC